MTRNRDFFFSVVLTSAQILFALAFAPSDSSDFLPIRPPEGWQPAQSRYERLNNWDSLHFFHVAEKGPQAPVGRPPTVEDVHSFRATLAFFPGYPLLSRILSPLGTQLALLVTAQCLAALFWFYFLTLLRRFGADERERFLAVISVFVFPSSFYLVAGYSESLLMAGMLGFLYWTEIAASSRSRLALILAGLHGAAMSGSRLVGIPLAGLPLFFLRRLGPFRAVLLTGLASLGGLAYFGYCHWKFGDWSLYFKVQEVGWANAPFYAALLNPLSYIPRFFFEHSMASINRAAVPLLVGLFLYTGWKDRDRSRRWPIYFLASALFYVSVSGKAKADMDGMIRYALPPYALLILALAQVREENRPVDLQRKWPRPTWVALALFSLAIQAWIVYRFLHGKWVS